jgi:cytochrome P450 family 135
MVDITDPSGTVSGPVHLGSLPRMSAPMLARHLGGLLRPGAGSSPLWTVGDRFMFDPPGFPPVLVTRSTDDIRAVFADSAMSFGQVLRRFTAHDVIFGLDAFIFLEAQDHRDERKKLAPHLHGRALKSYKEAMVDAVMKNIDKWPTGKPVSFLDIGYQLARDVMISVIFGITDPGRVARMESAMGDWIRSIESRGFLALSGLGLLTGGRALPYPPLKRREVALDKIIIEEIAERRAGRAPNNGALAQFMAEDPPRDDAELARGARGLVFAGYETTAVTLGWVGAFVSHSATVINTLEASVDAGEDDYLDAVITEAMRLRPAIPITGRRALQDTELNGVSVPKGATVMVPMLAVHERPEFYERPEEFLPERFVGKPAKIDTWLTFGGGAHRCLGGAFALFEARVLMRTLLEQRSFEPQSGVVAGTRPFHPMLFPRHGAQVVLNRR